MIEGLKEALLTAAQAQIDAQLRKATGFSFAALLGDHLDADPKKVPVVAEAMRGAEHANVQLALEGWLSDQGGKHRIVGVASSFMHERPTIASLVAPAPHYECQEGPVSYRTVHLSDRGTLSCLQSALILGTFRGGPAAVLVVGPTSSYGSNKVVLQVAATTKEAGEGLIGDLRKRMSRRNIYRGKVVSLGQTREGDTEIAFHWMPATKRDDIILPSTLLDRIERQTIGFSSHASRLRAAGRHLKRGLLLYGPPGTGKTLTACYLAARMDDRTVVVVTGRGMGLIEQAVAFARALEPATVIIEDVDLIAEERTRPGQSCNAVLFELLNAMDGLEGDADILFLLTTNRPDLLEPALAARPGRIDQAIEVPVPDSVCRRRLIEFYGEGLHLTHVDMDDLVSRTEGASAAFIRELLRKAALYAAYDGDEIRVHGRHLDEALGELMAVGGQLTRSLLGAALGNSTTN